MNSRTMRIPYVDDRDHTTSTHGGVITYWKKEAGQLTASNATFGSIEMIAKKHTAYAELPSELPEDAVGFSTFFNTSYPRAMAWGRDVGFWEGDGTDEPNGVLHSSNGALIEVTRAGAGAIDYADILGMFARMLPGSLSRSVWVANLDTIPEVMTIELSTGSPAVFQTNVPGAPPMTLLGRPLIFSEKVPALSAAADIGLYDFSQYLIGDRQAATAATSTEFKFDTDELAFRLIERLDGKPWMVSAVTPRNGTDTLSPFVTLAA
jgi:HK97 family phage major capsid protein